MEYGDIMVNEQCTSLQEIMEKEDEDANIDVFEEETFILNEETKIENVMYGQENLLYEDDGQNEVDAYRTDQDCDIDGNENHGDDDLSP